MAIEKTIIVNVDTGNSEKDLNKVVDSAENLKETLKDSEKQADKTAKEVKGIGRAGATAKKGLKAVSVGFKAIGTALKAAGIGLVIAAFVALSEAISENERASKVFKVAFEAVSIVTQDFINFIIDGTGAVVDFFKAVFENPQKSLKEFAKAFKENIQERFESYLDTLGFIASAVKKVFSGDFAGALEDVKSAGKESLDVLTGVNNSFDKGVDLVNSAVDATKKYGEELLKTSKNNIDLAKSAEIAAAKSALLKEEFEVQAEKLRQIRDNELISIDDRIKANDKLAGVLKKQQAAQIAEADAILASAAAQFAKNNNTENEIALIQAQADRKAVLNNITSQESEQLSNQNALIKEKNELVQSGIESDTTRALNQQKFNASLEQDELTRLEKQRENLDTEKEIEAERLQAKIDSFALGTQARLDAENEKKDRLQEIDQEITLNEDAQNKKRVENDKASADAKAKIQGAVLDVAQQGINVLKQVFEKNKEIQAGLVVAENAAGIAKILTNTAVANAAATAASPLTGGQPFVALNTISAGLGIASTVAATAKALSSLGKSGGGGGGASAPSGGGSAPAPAFNLVGGSDVSQVEDSINGGQKPVTAVVVGSQVTSQQEVDRAQAESASLG